MVSGFRTYPVRNSYVLHVNKQIWLLLAWVLGATDPTSGTVSTYEVIRGLGALLKKGWTPLRTILIASWDAEEVSSNLLDLGNY